MDRCWNKAFFFYVYHKVEAQAPCGQVLVYIAQSPPGVGAERALARHGRPEAPVLKAFAQVFTVQP